MLREEGEEEEDSSWLHCTMLFAHGKQMCSLTLPLLCMPTPGQLPQSTALLQTVTPRWLSFWALRPVSQGIQWQRVLAALSS